MSESANLSDERLKYNSSIATCHITCAFIAISVSHREALPLFTEVVPSSGTNASGLDFTPNDPKEMWHLGWEEGWREPLLAQALGVRRSGITLPSGWVSTKAELFATKPSFTVPAWAPFGCSSVGVFAPSSTLSLRQNPVLVYAAWTIIWIDVTDAAQCRALVFSCTIKVLYFILFISVLCN